MIRKQADSYRLLPYRDGLCKFRPEAIIRKRIPEIAQSPNTETIKCRRMVKNRNDFVRNLCPLLAVARGLLCNKRLR